MPLICSVYSRIKIPGYRTDWRRVVTALRRWGLIHLISKTVITIHSSMFFSHCIFVFDMNIKVN